MLSRIGGCAPQSHGQTAELFASSVPFLPFAPLMPVQSKPARVSEGVPAQSQHPAFNLRSSATRRSQSAVGTPSSSATSALPARRTTRSQGAAGAPASVASELPAHRNTRSSARVVPNVNAGRSKRTRESEAVEEPLARPAKRPSLKQAAVPAPDVDCFPSLVGAKDQHRSPEAQLKMSEDKAKHNARRWYKRCPVFIDRSVTAKELYARDKNTKKEKEKAESVMESMKSWAADAGSLAIVDRKGKLLFAYCGVAFPGSRHPTYGDLRAGRVKLKDLRPYPGSLGRTEDDVTDEMDHDGLQAPNLERTHIAMQNVFHVTPPVVSAADKRHRGQDDMISYAVNSQLQDDEDEAMDVDEADDSSEWYSDEEDEDDKEDDSDDDEDDDNDDEDDDDKNEERRR
ncbi:hypothetical protein NMY22_g18410 [Coprinellus aureogranulatus]|nr:hypothetical protein NMY22_g18410 [Coprinellus aureogranulatus]